MANEFSAWWMVLPKGKTHYSDCELRFRHGRHRIRSSQDARFFQGAWWRPVGGRWELINA